MAVCALTPGSDSDGTHVWRGDTGDVGSLAMTEDHIALSNHNGFERRLIKELGCTAERTSSRELDVNAEQVLRVHLRVRRQMQPESRLRSSLSAVLEQPPIGSEAGVPLGAADEERNGPKRRHRTLHGVFHPDG